ncbi:CG13198, partial [Drosophila busckii]
CARLLKFTNVKCADLPTTAGSTKYEYCRLKVIRRNVVELSLKVSLLQLPVTNLTARIQCFQRSVGYRPFLYNVYFDFCKLMSAKRYHISFEKFVFDTIRKHSNFNHSCPWTENYMMVDKYALDFSRVDMPVPDGVYRLDFTFFIHGIARTLTQVFFEKIE